MPPESRGVARTQFAHQRQAVISPTHVTTAGRSRLSEGILACSVGAALRETFFPLENSPSFSALFRNYHSTTLGENVNRSFRIAAMHWPRLSSREIE